MSTERSENRKPEYKDFLNFVGSYKNGKRHDQVSATDSTDSGVSFSLTNSSNNSSSSVYSDLSERTTKIGYKDYLEALGNKKYSPVKPTFNNAEENKPKTIKTEVFINISNSEQQEGIFKTFKLSNNSDEKQKNGDASKQFSTNKPVLKKQNSIGRISQKFEQNNRNESKETSSQVPVKKADSIKKVARIFQQEPINQNHTKPVTIKDTSLPPKPPTTNLKNPETTRDIAHKSSEIATTKQMFETKIELQNHTKPIASSLPPKLAPINNVKKLETPQDVSNKISEAIAAKPTFETKIELQNHTQPIASSLPPKPAPINNVKKLETPQDVSNKISEAIAAKPTFETKIELQNHTQPIASSLPPKPAPTNPVKKLETPQDVSNKISEAIAAKPTFESKIEFHVPPPPPLPTFDDLPKLNQHPQNGVNPKEKPRITSPKPVLSKRMSFEGLVEQNCSPPPPPPLPVGGLSLKHHQKVDGNTRSHRVDHKSATLDRNDPRVKKLVYGALRNMYGTYHDKANDYLATLPKSRVRKNNGLDQIINSIASQGGLEKLTGRTNPTAEQE